MSNTPSSIIINIAKIDRIDPENVGFELTASVLDNENDTIPWVEVSLIINRSAIDNIVSDPDWYIDIKRTFELQEWENISIQLKEVISWVKSKVRILSDVPNIEENNSDWWEKKNQILTEEEKNALTKIQNNASIFKEKEFDLLRWNKNFIIKAIKINPFIYEHISDFLKDDDEVINTAIDSNIEVVYLFDEEVGLKQHVLEILKNNPVLMTRFIGKKIIEHSEIFDIHNEFFWKLIYKTKDINSYRRYQGIGNFTIISMDNINIIKLALEHPQFNKNICLTDFHFKNYSWISKNKKYNEFLIEKWLEKYCIEEK